jgi:hypothetical protein
MTYMWTSCFGTIKRSSPTRARPVARTRFSPLLVRGMSEVPVWRPSSDHSVSPWRTMKHRGVVMAVEGRGGDWEKKRREKEERRLRPGPPE